MADLFCCSSADFLRCLVNLDVSFSVVTKALVVETEAKTETAGFETETKAEAVASETEAEAEAVYLETETEAQGSWLILLAVPYNHL